MGDNKKKLSSEETEKNIDTSAKQANLDALLFDNDDDSDRDALDDTKNFDSFMAEYRNLMHQNMASTTVEEKSEEERESEFLKSTPRSAKSRVANRNRTTPKVQKRDDWDDDITLEPQSYADLNEEDKVMHDSLPEEEEHIPDFNLGDKETVDMDNKFQLSINFSGEQNQEAAPDEEKSNVYNPEKPRFLDWVFDFAEMFIFVLLAVMIITSFVFKHSVVEGDSMLNTLHDGEHLIITDLFYTPERGDIIVFEDYSTQLKKAVVKRVIGLPGDTVEVKMNEALEYEVYINGSLLEEEYAYHSIDNTAPGIGVWTLAEDEIFVMGDNRYNSTDSRSSLVGPVKIDSILGKVILRFYPFDKFGKVE